jgi:hypothetical protein
MDPDDDLHFDDEEAHKALADVISDPRLARWVLLPDRAQHLVAAVAHLDRISRLCHALFGGRWLSIRRQDRHDEYIYQHLRHAVITQLSQAPDWKAELTKANEVLPEVLPSDELSKREWRLGIEPGISELRATLVRRCVEEGVSPFEAGIDPLLASVDQAIDLFAEQAREANAQFEQQDNLQAPEQLAHPPVSDRRPSQASRSGRTRTPLNYETARRAYWDFANKYESYDEANRSRFPNQKELCDWFAEKGIQIRDRTLRSRIKEWSAAGLQWPPLSPEE